MRFYEWAKFIIKEKFSVFIKGFIGGSTISWTLLFIGDFNTSSLFVLFLTYVFKVIAVCVSGFLSGAVTVWGADFAKSWQQRWKKRKKK